MDIYEAVWKTLFVIKVVEKTRNENIFQLISLANDAYLSRESGLTKRPADKCQKCGGSGRIKEDYNLLICPRCDGTGICR